MRVLLLFIVGSLSISCNNQKIDQLKSDVREIKQSLQRIEALLGGRTPVNSNTITDQNPYGESYKPTPKSPATTGRCQAITKKGKQCSRKARSGGYCWQHGG